VGPRAGWAQRLEEIFSASDGDRTPVDQFTIPTVQEAGWAPEPVWTQRFEEKSSAPAGDRTPAFQSVAVVSRN
jgi:hypothetical protein